MLNQLGTHNAYTFEFDTALLSSARDVYANYVSRTLWNDPSAPFEGGKVLRQRIAVPPWGHDYLLVTFGKAPLLWISNDCAASYGMFKKFFDAIGITEDVKKLVDYDRAIVMYSGFFVVSNRMEQPKWHVDYQEGANGFTLITPLFTLEEGHGNLVYRNEDNSVGRYIYKYGEAIMFGDRFLHATEPYPTAQTERVLLSITFGTDKVEHWPTLGQTIGGQSDYYILPCGHQAKTCSCLPPKS